MKTIAAGLLLTALAFTAMAQDWYHEREERFRGEEWRAHVFAHVRTDLDHIWSANHAADRERERIQRTKDELTKIQADIDAGRWDNGVVNDVVDSLRKSADDERLSKRDRDVLADDVAKIREFQDRHNHR
jgi:hypothetical protein